MESQFTLSPTLYLKKTWKIKNTGSEEWGEGVELVFVRGNETLPLAKRIPVANTKPQESTEILAMIQIPKLAGRFSACFRLEKNGQRFGPKVWVDVQALSESENENEDNNKASESKQPQPVMVKCICGVPMIETSPLVAYFESAEVHCDLCGEHCPVSSTIYHCGVEKNESHPNGYDLCSNCAFSQIESFEQPPNQQQQSQEKLKDVPREEQSKEQKK